jgi:WD40 repeat protein
MRGLPLRSLLALLVVLGGFLPLRAQDVSFEGMTGPPRLKLRRVLGSHDLHPMGQVTTVAFSSDERRVFSVAESFGWAPSSEGWRASLQCWSAVTGAEDTAALGSGIADEVCLSKNGAWCLAWDSREDRLTRWKIETGAERRTIAAIGSGTKVQGLAISDDGSLGCYSRADGERGMFLIRFAGAGGVSKLCRGCGENVAFSPSGKHLANAAPAGLAIFDIAEVASARFCEPDPIGAWHTRPVAFSWREDLVATGGQTVQVWSVATGELVQSFAPPAGIVISLAFSHDGKTLLGGCWTGSIERWELQSGRRLDPLEDGQGPVTALAVSADDTRAVSGDLNGKIRTWDLVRGRTLLANRGHLAAVTCLQGREPGTLVSGSKDETVRIWSLDDGAERLRLEAGGSVECVALSPDRRTIVAGVQEADRWHGGAARKTLLLWDVAHAEARRPLAARALAGVEDTVSAVAISPDGKRLAWAKSLHDEGARLLALETGETTQLDAEDVMALAFTHDGTRLLESTRNSLRLLALGDENPLLDPLVLGDGRSVFAFSPDGSRVAVEREILDSRTGKSLATLLLPDGDPSGPDYPCRDFYPRQLAWTASAIVIAGDSAVLVWDEALTPCCPQCRTPESCGRSPMAVLDIARCKDKVTALTAFGKWVVVGTERGAILVFETQPR